MNQLILFCFVGVIMLSSAFILVGASQASVQELKRLADQCAAGDSQACQKLSLIARTDCDSAIRCQAIFKLTDQGILAQIANEDSVWEVRKVAIFKLTDRSILNKIAASGNEWEVRKTANLRLADLAMKAPEAVHLRPFCVSRARKISELEDLDPILVRIAFDGGIDVREDAGWCIARLKLAIQEPRIKLRFPRIRCVVDERETSARYSPTKYSPYNPKYIMADGELVTIQLVQDETKLAEGTWSTNFPDQVSGSEFWGARASAFPLLQELLRSDVFTSDDLVELAHSNFPEVSEGSLASLNDPGTLTKLAIEDPDISVRCLAIAKLHDVKTLKWLAAKDRNAAVREAAAKRIDELLH